MTSLGPPPAVVETHGATVFFVGDRAYKLKKAVDLGVFDHTTREARLHACREEVALNRRLAPDVYLGVLDVVDESGAPVDHLVEMRRLPEHRRLARCIERGEDVDDALRGIARSVAALHEASTPDARHGVLASAASVQHRWVEGFDQLRPLRHLIDRPERLDRIELLVGRYLGGRGPLFDARIADGRIRDGHGDLQAEDVFLLDDGPRVLDCIEFGEEYRWGDVLADVAFLAMDLERLGRRDLADQFLAHYCELTADRWPASLAHHYVAYRAQVRAKVGVLRAEQQGGQADLGVDRYLDLALDHLEAGRVQMVLVGGLPGTGKSTVSVSIGDRIEAVVLRTDEVRRGLAPGLPTELYRPEAVDAVYRELLAEAEQLVGLGESVVLDATWSNAAHRELARQVAVRTGTDLTELRCVLSADEAAARIRRRAAAGGDPSEATPAVAEAMAGRFAPWPEAVDLATAGPPARALDHALHQLDPLDPHDPLAG